MTMNPKFELGRTVVIAAINTRMNTNTDFERFEQASLDRYINGNWGANRMFVWSPRKRGTDAAQ